MYYLGQRVESIEGATMNFRVANAVQAGDTGTVVKVDDDDDTVLVYYDRCNLTIWTKFSEIRPLETEPVYAEGPVILVVDYRSA